jgi:hypothetical protein
MISENADKNHHEVLLLGLRVSQPDAIDENRAPRHDALLERVGYCVRSAYEGDD